ncbi:MAG: carbohydrate kinase [Burkholderiales bacterium RIFCSPLOWO2_12_67_14]|nr:MAG: carbohydrate kinase [Burkholderiales bacterium RIFCSPLOWO2_02_FULL_67_64]OGB42266.1 MAG: carbohydrate kinase [Burkholderiales bacterium RIFCSPHIGHO2_12_FULL_67_38]OGB46236.1 MAG: carbohydrate kinase [Burkholderiales bacterium RIFCSPLOWO2_12_67_14]
MKTNILIGIDLGSSSLKALALEAVSGRTLALSRMPLPHDRLPGGGCELGAPAIRAALSQVLRDVAHQLGPRVGEVRAIGCTGHGAGLYALDARHELVGGRAVASTDQRADARALALARQCGPQLWAEVGCQPWPGQPTVIAAELLGADAVRSGAVQRLMFAKDYLGFLLTGEIATDASDASTAGLISVATGTWSPLAFAASGIADLSPRAFGPLVPSGEVIGTLQPSAAEAHGLPAGIPVAMGAIDLLASMTALRAQERGRAVSVLGTWCVNAVIGPVMAPRPDVAAVVHFGPRDQRLYMENSPSSMANIAWLAGVFGLPDARAVVDLAMSVPFGAGGLRFLPFVNGGAGVTAGFVGLKSHHTRGDMARAVVDAVAALHARHTARLATAGLPVSANTVLGGGASDARLVRLLAGLLGRPVERCADDETGARGAAIYAAMSQGIDTHPLRAPCDTVEPDAGQARAHADFNATFNELIATMSPVFGHLAGSPPSTTPRPPQALCAPAQSAEVLP